MKTIAFFDFDGTLTRRDTLFDFTRFAFGNIRFFFKIALLFPRVIMFALNMTTRDTVARRFIRYFYKEQDIGTLELKAREYAAQNIPKLLNPDVYEAFCRHRDNGDEIVIVSASPELWLTPWCKGHGAGLIATRLKTDQYLYTGDIAGNRCIGKEKVERIKKIADTSDYDKVYAYGNSDGDVAMLNMAEHAFYVSGGRLKNYVPR